MRAHFSTGVVLAALWFCPLGAGAQTTPPAAGIVPQVRVHGSGVSGITSASLKALEQLISLSPTQIASLSQIRDEYRQSTKPLLPPPGVPMGPDSRAKLVALRQKEETDMLAVLSADQKEKLPAALTQIRALAYDGINPSAMNVLKLTDDQIKQLEQIYQDARKKTGALARDVRKDQGIPIMDDARTRATQVLTPAQQAALEKYKAPHKAPIPGAPKQ